MHLSHLIWVDIPEENLKGRAIDPIKNKPVKTTVKNDLIRVWLEPFYEHAVVLIS